MRSVRSRTTALLSGLAAAGIALTACGGPPAADSDGKIDVVASTTVWGDVVREIGGDSVDVESIISDPAADPHSYESTRRTQPGSRRRPGRLQRRRLRRVHRQTISASGRTSDHRRGAEEAGGHDHRHEHDHSGTSTSGTTWTCCRGRPAIAGELAGCSGGAERFQQQAAAFRDRIGASAQGRHRRRPAGNRCSSPTRSRTTSSSTELNDITPVLVRAVEAVRPVRGRGREIHNAIESDRRDCSSTTRKPNPR